MGAEQATASPIIPLLLIFMIIYFLVIRPEKQKKQQQKNLTENLKKNDQVVTIGGIHGTVTAVKETSVILRVDDNAKIEVDKDSISTLTKSQNQNTGNEQRNS